MATQQQSSSWWVTRPPQGFTAYVETVELPRMRVSREAAVIEGIRIMGLRELKKGKPGTRSPITVRES